MHKPSTNNFKFDKGIVERLDQCITLIKAMYRDRLIEISVFGSYAKSRHKKYSAIDLLVIVKDSDERFIRRNAQLEKLLNEEDRVPQIEPLVYTCDDIMELIHKKEGFIASALKESIQIWNTNSKINIAAIKDSNIVHSQFSPVAPDLEEIEI